MNETQTRLLIQRELDGALSADEEMKLRRVLQVSDSAVSFRANLSQIVAAAHELELPEDVRPGDSSLLAVEIIDQLPEIKSNFWEPIFDLFSNRRSIKSDPRSSRSVGSSVGSSASRATLRHSAGQQTIPPGITGNTTSVNSKVDPAVLNPASSNHKDQSSTSSNPTIQKSPVSNPQVDQYITGTHSSVSSLAKKLNKNQNAVATQDVGKTLADAIREKVHEQQREPIYTPPAENAIPSQTEIVMPPQSLPSQSFPSQSLPSQSLPSQSLPSQSLPSQSLPSQIPAANITVQGTLQHGATSVSLSGSTVLTFAQTPAAHDPEIQVSPVESSPIDSLSIDCSSIEVSPVEVSEWKSGTFPAVSGFAKPQNETGPLTPWSTPESFWNKTPAPENPWMQPATVTDNSWVPPATPENEKPAGDPWAPPLEVPAPTIVPVTRNALPIEAIGDRINTLFSEQADRQQPMQNVLPPQNFQPTPEAQLTKFAQPSQVSQPEQEKHAMEDDVNACLSSIGRLCDIRYATNSPGTISNLGRFLLTDQTVESIEKCITKGMQQSHARVVTLEAAQQLAAALEPVTNMKGVIGYLVCGYDALPIASSLPPEVDVEMLGGCALVTYMNSHSIIKVMGHSRIRTMICQTPLGCMLLSDFGKGLLVTVTSENDPAMLTMLTDTISELSAD